MTTVVQVVMGVLYTVTRTSLLVYGMNIMSYFKTGRKKHQKVETLCLKAWNLTKMDLQDWNLSSGGLHNVLICCKHYFVFEFSFFTAAALLTWFLQHVVRVSNLPVFFWWRWNLSFERANLLLFVLVLQFFQNIHFMWFFVPALFWNSEIDCLEKKILEAAICSLLK